MSIDSDIIIDRKKLKRSLAKWQVVALGLVVILLITLAATGGGFSGIVGKKSIGDDFIARIEIEGVIVEDSFRDDVIEKIAENDDAKALIVNVNSPGGTTVGGEELYEQFKAISDSGKPVVFVMKTLATSAGYLIALSGDHVIARNGTITGSIGVIVQSAEFTDLAESLGVKLETFKSGELKAVPSPLEKTTPAARESIDKVVMDFYEYFVGLVATERGIPLDVAKKIADGRIYTGSQALDLKLIDAIGGVEEAKNWLAENGVDKKLEIEDISIDEPQDPLEKLLFGDMKKSQIFSKLGLNGLLAIWYN